MYEAGGPQGTSRDGHDAFSVGDVEYLKMLVGHENGYRELVGLVDPVTSQNRKIVFES